MYQYYQGLTIREGTTGVPAERVKQLFEEVGWSRGGPAWQDEKFSLIFENSTWAFTVWEEERMVGMVRVVSDQIMMATIMDLAVSESYRGKGLAHKLISLCMEKLPHGDWFAHTSEENFSFYESCGFQVEENCSFYGYRKARDEGHRL
ncbi:GNAT family N-acetyltransferase [Halobacillus faecis]|uniref:N-acetyltransferase n=1 Tax=Halobacillus faecis TaxID=360184 RepID=A0A511WRF4_9BACI|nr:GNAT family N-acetyltransferase [Halobacillus faecis]GEN52813.1 N-acetyltransferase [Halobacillus faecis]